MDNKKLLEKIDEYENEENQYTGVSQWIEEGKKYGFLKYVIKKALNETLVTYKDMPMFAPRKEGKPNWGGLWSLTMELQKTKRKRYLDKLNNQGGQNEKGKI